MRRPAVKVPFVNIRDPTICQHLLLRRERCCSAECRVRWFSAAGWWPLADVVGVILTAIIVPALARVGWKLHAVFAPVCIVGTPPFPSSVRRTFCARSSPVHKRKRAHVSIRIKTSTKAVYLPASKPHILLPIVVIDTAEKVSHKGVLVCGIQCSQETTLGTARCLRLCPTSHG